MAKVFGFKIGTAGMSATIADRPDVFKKHLRLLGQQGRSFDLPSHLGHRFN